MDNRSIGIFDSGVGGLTVLLELKKALSHENFIYFGDTARVPYGGKSKDVVMQYSMEAAHFLKDKGIKILVIACNTATAFALDYLRQELDIPVIGVIKAGAASCVENLSGNRVGVIGTKGTVKSQAYNKALLELNPNLIIHSKACPLFVPVVEEGMAKEDLTKGIIRYYLQEFVDTSVESIILGCTHYPVMEEVIKEVLGDRIALINPAYETAQEVKKVVSEKGYAAERKEKGSVKYYCSDEAESFYEVGKRIVPIESCEIEEIDLMDIVLNE